MLKYLSILIVTLTAPLFLLAQNTLRLCTAPNTGYHLQVTANGRNIYSGAADTCITLPYLNRTTYYCTLNGTGERLSPKEFKTDTLTPGITLRLYFRPAVKNLDTATVRNNLPFMRGDTLVIPVDSIKTRPHASATELMNKVPGIDADAAGNISVNGKKVDEITVNGQALFGGNAKATLEAIKSNMVQQLEVVEKENSSGQTRAYLNLKLKKNRERGWYGSAEQRVGNERTRNTDLRLNHIAPGNLLNIFVNSNNLNEKALSEQNLFTFTNLFKRDISVYSITAQQAQGAVTFTNNEDNLFTDDNRDLGRNKNTSAGISYSRTAKKGETSVFAIAEKAEQTLEENLVNRKFLSAYTRLDSSNGLQQKERSSAFGNLTQSLKLNEYNTFKTGITLLLYRNERSNNQQQNNNLLDEAGTLLSRNTLARTETERLSRFGIIHQTSWLHRYKRPAKVFSLYAKWTVQESNGTHGYSNLPQPPLTGNDQQVTTKRAYAQAEVQAIQSFPLTRKWLLELQATHQFDHLRINQQALSFYGVDELLLPNISAAPYTTQQQRTQLLANMLYKTTYTTIIGGAGISRWSARRSRNGLVYSSPEKTKLLPAIMFKRRFKNSGNTLTLRYRAGWTDPQEAQLNPLEDSASLQQVNAGNPYLESVLRHSASMGFTRNVSVGQVFSTALQYSLVEDPVVVNTIFLPAPAIRNSYTQYGRQQQVTGSLFWLDYKNTRPFSYFTSILAGLQESYALNNGVPFRFRAFLGSFYLSGRYRVNKKMELDLRWQSMYNAYTSAAESGRNDLRSSIRLRADNSFKKEFYTLITTELQLNGNNNPEQKAGCFISAEVSKYFSKENKWRVVAAVKNLLNTGSSFAFNQNATQQAISRYNNLPRVFTIGLTAYFERWKKK